MALKPTYDFSGQSIGLLPIIAQRPSPPSGVQNEKIDVWIKSNEGACFSI
jgi:hypothetical protein